GSAVNDTTRQVGGALGVAIIGSVMSSIYASQMGDFLAGKPIKGAQATAIKESLGAALAAAGNAAKVAPDLATSLAQAANSGFVDGMSAAVVVGAGVAFVGAVVAFFWLPARARREDVEAQHAAQAERDAALSGVTS